jgi:hypothetical protein
VNLDRFLAAFERFRAFFIAVGIVSSQGMGEPEIFFEHVILKRQLVVKLASDIGVNDQDLVGIFATDDPIVMTDDEAPVTKLLKRKRTRI